MPVNQQKTTTPLAGQVVRVADVTASHRDEMYRLMCQYYDNLSRDAFNRDFEEKDWVIVASDPQDGRRLPWRAALGPSP